MLTTEDEYLRFVCVLATNAVGSSLDPPSTSSFEPNSYNILHISSSLHPTAITRKKIHFLRKIVRLVWSYARAR